MKTIIVGTTPTLIAPAGNRDIFAIFNNDAAYIYLCFDGDDGVSTPPTITVLSSAFGNAVTVNSLQVASTVGIQPGQLVTGTGIPASIYVSAIDQILGIVYTTSFTSTAGSSGNYTFGTIALTTLNGFPLGSAQWLALNNDNGRNLLVRAVYAISAAGNANVRVQGV